MAVVVILAVGSGPAAAVRYASWSSCAILTRRRIAGERSHLRHWSTRDCLPSFQFPLQPPPIILSNRPQRINIQFAAHLIRASDQQLNLVGPKERKRVAAAHGEEPPLEWLKLPRHGRVEGVPSIRINVFAPIGRRHRPRLTTRAERNDRPVPVSLRFNSEIEAKCALDVRALVF